MVGEEEKEEEMTEKTSEKRRKKLVEKSCFSLTCNLLSQYMKKNGRFGDLRLDMSPWPLHLKAKGEYLRLDMSPWPLHLKAKDFSGKNKDQISTSNTNDCQPSNEKERGKEKRQLTIFYGGKVVVFEDFPEDRAADLISMAIGGSVAAAADGDLKNGSVVEPPASGDGPLVALRLQNRTNQAGSSDMPIARRNSLNRFLEKRKDRMALPSTSSEQIKADENQAWLSLGPQALNPESNSQI